jgi:hypothetical protein
MVERTHFAHKHDGDRRAPAVDGWPGPVGWWYLPSIWAIVLLVAALGWALK